MVRFEKKSPFLNIMAFEFILFLFYICVSKKTHL